jgi:hypothetical protein
MKTAVKSVTPAFEQTNSILAPLYNKLRNLILKISKKDSLTESEAQLVYEFTVKNAVIPSVTFDSGSYYVSKKK